MQMMGVLFALSDAVESLIVAGVFGVITLVIKDYLDRLRIREAVAKADSAKAEAALAVATVHDVTTKQSDKLTGMAVQVKGIQIQADGLSSKLMDKTREAGEASGALAERDRAEAKLSDVKTEIKENGPPIPVVIEQVAPAAVTDIKRGLIPGSGTEPPKEPK
jgi:hypothetical protein